MSERQTQAERNAARAARLGIDDERRYQGSGSNRAQQNREVNDNLFRADGLSGLLSRFAPELGERGFGIVNDVMGVGGDIARVAGDRDTAREARRYESGARRFERESGRVNDRREREEEREQRQFEREERRAGREHGGEAPGSVSGIRFADRRDLQQAAEAFDRVVNGNSQGARDAFTRDYLNAMGLSVGRSVNSGGDGRIYVDSDQRLTVNGRNVQIPRGDYSATEINQMFETALDPTNQIDLAGTVTRAIPSSASFAPAAADAARGAAARAPENRDGAAASPAAPQAPTTRLAGGNGNVTMADAAYQGQDGLARAEQLLNAETVTNAQGQTLTNGQRLSEALRTATEELRQLPAGQPEALQSATFLQSFRQGQTPENFNALYNSATEEERVAIRNEIRNFNTELGRVDPRLQPGLERITAGLDQTPAQAAQAQQDGAARLSALSGMQFTPEFLATEEGQNVKKLWDEKMAQENAAQEATGFGAMFTQLFTMLGNILSGKPELNRSAEDILAEHQAHLTPESQQALTGLQSGRAPVAVDGQQQQLPDHGDRGTPQQPIDQGDRGTLQQLNGETPPNPAQPEQPATAEQPGTPRQETLQATDVGRGVADMQRRLEAIGFATDGAADGQVTGELGEGTTQAIRQAQGKYGLAQTGQYNQQFLNMLSADPDLQRALQNVSGGQSVEAAQAPTAAGTRPQETTVTR